MRIVNGRLGLGLVVVSMSALLFGCPKKEEAAADAGAAQPTASAAPEAAAAAPLADNQSDVTQYPDQAATSGSAPIGWFVANIRTQANSGSPLIAVLKKGTDTTKIATKDAFTLVTFKEPSAPGRTLMGWLDSKAYTPQIWDAGKQCIACPHGEVSIMLEGGHEQCVIPCDSSNDTCPTGKVCDGDAPKCHNGEIAEDTEFCRTGNKKGGTPTATDAGTTPTADAGTAADAGASKAVLIRVAMDAGTCPPSYSLVAAGACRLTCNTLNTQDVCPTKSSCKSFGGGKFKACADPAP